MPIQMESVRWRVLYLALFAMIPPYYVLLLFTTKTKTKTNAETLVFLVWSTDRGERPTVAENKPEIYKTSIPHTPTKSKTYYYINRGHRTAGSTTTGTARCTRHIVGEGGAHVLLVLVLVLKVLVLLLWRGLFVGIVSARVVVRLRLPLRRSIFKDQNI